MSDNANKMGSDIFLLTPLREGRPAGTPDVPQLARLFLLTPLREGRPAPGTSAAETISISTHAPAGGATRDAGRAAAGPPISTHAPAGGATPTGAHDAYNKGISTHAPAGGATFVEQALARCSVISTHAPAGGATSSCARSTPSRKFLLTPLREGRPAYRRRPWRFQAFLLTPLREGRRNLRCSYCYQGCKFLLTPLREGRHCDGGRTERVFYFYSRPCGRGDLHTFQYHQYLGFISTHAPAGGATSTGHISEGWGQIFLLTPLREGRQQFSTSPS